MAKKKKAKLAKELDLLIPMYKWEFLRRNKDYIKDCESWTKRTRNQWNKREIVLGYKFNGKISDWGKPHTKEAMTATLAYCRRHFEEWQSERFDSWRKYKVKWAINLPFNPNLSYVPFFMEIAPFNIITEPPMSSDGGNDFLLEKGTSSLLQVNWEANVEDLNLSFERILQLKKILLKNKRKAHTSHTHFDVYHDALIVWDLKQEEKTYADMQDSKWFTPNQKRSSTNIQDCFQVAEKLIKGGYKEIR